MLKKDRASIEAEARKEILKKLGLTEEDLKKGDFEVAFDDVGTKFVQLIWK